MNNSQFDNKVQEYLFPSIDLTKSSDEIATNSYGSLWELKNDARRHQNFSGSHGRELKLSEMFTSTCMKYKTLRGKEVYLKQDIFAYLHRRHLMRLKEKNDDLAPMVLAVIFKFHEDKLANCCEFVAQDGNLFEAIDADIDNLVIKIVSQSKQLPTITTFEEALTYLKGILPVEWDDVVHEPLMLKLRVMYNLDRETCTHDLEKVLNYIKALLKSHTQLFETYPHIFLPASETKSSDHLKAVRLFQDGNRCFLMRDEVDKILGRPSQPQNTKLETVEYKHVMLELNQHKIEVVKTPISRTRHRAQPIRDSNWKLCKLASDCLFEFLYDIIHGFELYQRIDETDLATVDECLEKLGQYFHLDSERIYFVSLEEFHKIPTAKDIFAFVKEREVRQIRNVKLCVFSQDDLAEELERLGLPRIFEDIFDHVVDVHTWVVRERATMTLRNCDMKEAVVQCQLACLLKRYPSILKFIHDQNGCHRIAYTSCCSKPITYLLTHESQFTTLQITNAEVITTDKVSFLARPDGWTVIYNLFDFDRPVQNDPEVRLFMMKGEEYGRMKKSGMSEAEIRSCTKNFERFTTGRNVENVFIRCFDITRMHQSETIVVFAEELLYVIQYLLRKRGDKTQNDKLKSYFSMWKSDEPGVVPKTIYRDQFETALDDFNIEQSLITLVPDILFSKTDVLLTRFTLSSVIFTPTFKGAFSSSEAIFGIFIECLGLWWDPELRKRILEAMKNISMSTGNFHSVESIKQITSDLKDSASHDVDYIRRTILDGLNNDLTSQELETINEPGNFKAFRVLTMTKFLKMCKHVHLNLRSPLSIGKEKLANTYVQCWKARILICWELCNQLFGEEHPELKEHVRSGIRSRAPIDEWMDEEEFQSTIVNMTQNEYEKRARNREVRITEPEHFLDSQAVLKEIIEYSKQIDPVDLSDIRVEYVTTDVPGLEESNVSHIPVKVCLNILANAAMDREREMPGTYYRENLRPSKAQCLRIVTKKASTQTKKTKMSTTVPLTGSRKAESPNSLRASESSEPSEAPDSSSSASSTPPPAQTKRKVLGELFKLKQESLDSQESGKSEEIKEEPPTSQGANIKYISKKNKKRIRQLDHKPKLLERMEITDKSPPSNNCVNEKCKRTNEICYAKSAALAESEKEVEELKKDIRVLKREFNVEAVAKREKELGGEIEKLKKQLEESMKREEQLKNENQKLVDSAEKQEKQHEKEMKKILRDSEKKVEEVVQELEEARKSVENTGEQLSTANSQVKYLQEQVEDARLQLQMPPETSILYSRLKELEQLIRWQQPLEEVRQQAQRIIEHSAEEDDREGAKRTLEYYERIYDNYMEKLTSRIEILKLNPEISTKTFDTTDPMPPFPDVSTMFKDAYKKTFA